MVIAMYYHVFPPASETCVQQCTCAWHRRAWRLSPTSNSGDSPRSFSPHRSCCGGSAGTLSAACGSPRSAVSRRDQSFGWELHRFSVGRPGRPATMKDADGRFWVVVNPAAKGTVLPTDTVVQISIWPVEAPRSSVRTETAKPDEHEPSRRTAAFVIDREGKYRCQGCDRRISGPSGTRDRRGRPIRPAPRPMLIVVYALPFVLIGFVWLKLLLRRRSHKFGTA